MNALMGMHPRFQQRWDRMQQRFPMLGQMPWLGRFQGFQPGPNQNADAWYQQRMDRVSGRGWTPINEDGTYVQGSALSGGRFGGLKRPAVPDNWRRRI